MSIEERLDELVERHKALTQSVEILAALVRANEERLGQVMEAITSLARIAEAHELGLDSLDNQ